MTNREDGLSAARGCLNGLLIATVFWALVALVVFLVMRGNDSRTVPGEVLGDGMSAAAQQAEQVTTWGAAELDHLARQGWDLPVHSLSAAPMFGAKGVTIITPVPTRHDILLFYSVRPDEASTRKTAAHEAAHMLMDVAGVRQSETLADSFAACFGSPPASTYALKDFEWRGMEPPDCLAVEMQLAMAGKGAQ